MAKLNDPRHEDLEAAVIGTCLEYPLFVNEIRPIVRPVDFFVTEYRQVYTAMLDLADRDKPVSILTVKQVVEGAEMMSLTALISRSVVPGEAILHAQTIREDAVRRSVLAFARSAALRAVDQKENMQTMVSGIEDAWLEIQREKPAEWINQRELLMQQMDLMRDRWEHGGMAGIPSGFPLLDDLTTGWKPGHLIFLAAAPKMGKTSLGLHFALNAGVPVLFFTLEMLASELADRQIAAKGEVDSQLIKLGRMSPADQVRAIDATGELSALPIGWVEQGGLTATDIRSMARRFKARYGLGLIVIDQLDRVLETEKRGENLTTRIGRTVRKLKEMARDLKVPVICLVQVLDKQTAARKNPRPTHGDVRDSSNPDQEADVMLYLYRPEFYKPARAELRGKAEIIVARQRSGASGTSVWVTWHPRYTSFSDLPVEMWPKEEDLK